MTIEEIINLGIDGLTEKFENGTPADRHEIKQVLLAYYKQPLPHYIEGNNMVQRIIQHRKDLEKNVDNHID